MYSVIPDVSQLQAIDQHHKHRIFSGHIPQKKKALSRTSKYVRQAYTLTPASLLVDFSNIRHGTIELKTPPRSTQRPKAHRIDIPPYNEFHQTSLVHMVHL